MLKIYEYKNCGTCRKALQFLDKNKIPYQKVAIREQPPSLSELKQMLACVGDIKKLFNTSGQDYRALGLSAKLPKLSQSEGLDLLTKNGNLVKRPFVLSGNQGWVGFNEDIWKTHLLDL